jgi:hypothetical protein
MTKLIETRPTGPAVPLPPPIGLGGQPPKRTPSGVRALWKVFAGLLIVATLVWGPYQVVTLLAHEERVEEESWPADGIERLQIDSANGRVEIVATERATIDVRAEISDGLRPTGESRTLVGDTLHLRATCPLFGSNFCWVNYEVLVPRGLEIVVDGHNGSVTVSGSEAPLTLDSENGSIRVDDVSGPLHLTSDNGRVEGTGLRSAVVLADSDNGSVTLEFDEAPMTVNASTSNGSVEVVVPDDRTAYRVELDADNGRERLEVPTDPNSSRTLTLRTDNGNVTARIR